MRSGLRKGNPGKELARRFRKSLREEACLRPGLKLGAAVSGGADSVAMLRLLGEAREELGLVVSAVHFNHKLRGQASEGDEKFVVALAEQLGMTLHIGRADVAARAKREKVNLEDAARRARYGYFARLVEQGVVDVVATAHTMDDQAETVLAHVLRGTGIAGLGGIHPVAEGVTRPLLGFRRAELRAFLRAQRLDWREDESNRDTRRNRARMRRQLFPLLEKEFNPEVTEHLAKLGERAREHSALAQALTARLFAAHARCEDETTSIGVKELAEPLALAGAAGDVLRARLLQKIVERGRQWSGQLSAEHIAAILRMAREGEPGKRLQLPGGVDVVREREALVFGPRREC